MLAFGFALSLAASPAAALQFTGTTKEGEQSTVAASSAQYKTDAQYKVGWNARYIELARDMKQIKQYERHNGGARQDYIQGTHGLQNYFGLRHAVVAPEECDDLMEDKGCGFTAHERCPDQPNPENKDLPVSQNRFSLKYRCCCEVGLWRKEAKVEGWENKDATAALYEKADYCKERATADPVTTKCEWTKLYPCRNQFRSEVFIDDAGGVIDEEYTCCCTMGYWWKNMKADLKDFDEALLKLPKADQELMMTKKDHKKNHDESTLMFVHIPKTAGTAIEDASGDVEVWYPRKWSSYWHGVAMPDGSHCEKYHVPPQYLEVLGEHGDGTTTFKYNETFCVTRHPYERAVSEYLYQLSVEWGPYMSMQYRTGLLDKPKCSAAGLNNFLFRSLNHVREGRKFMHDCHFVPQHEYIFGKDGTKWCKNPMRFDELPGAFNDLMEEHGNPARLTATRDNNSTQACTQSLTVENLDRPTIELLDEVYKNDFKLLGYDKKKF